MLERWLVPCLPGGLLGQNGEVDGYRAFCRGCIMHGEEAVRRMKMMGQPVRQLLVCRRADKLVGKGVEGPAEEVEEV